MEGAIAHVVASGEQRTSDVAAGSTSFEDLHVNRNILNGLQEHKFLTPTKIQAAAIPIAFAGMDLLVQSKSGTGKTLIYLLAAFQLLQKSVHKPQVLIIVPTRELAIQVEDTAHCLTRRVKDRRDYKTASSIGGTDVKKDRLNMAHARIVVGTPGRLLHLMRNRVFNSSCIKLLVLDEADQLYATQSLQKDVQALLEPILPECQVIACSATYPNGLDDRLAKLMRNPILVSNSERATVLLGIRQFVYELPEQPNSMQEMVVKLGALRKIFDQLLYEQAILFASSQSRADSFCNYLIRNNVECNLMSGAMKQEDRLANFKAYRNFQTRTMVATDLMARGVDSSHANLVVNLDPPKDLVTYLHRIGRAGRFGSKGIAITFISSPQQCQHFKRIIAEAGTGMSVLQFPDEQRAGFDFWNFDSYDFPYFQKIEAHEQEEAELKRIKQRWKGKAELTSPTVESPIEHLENEVVQKPAEQVENSAEQEPKQNDELISAQVVDIADVELENKKDACQLEEIMINPEKDESQRPTELQLDVILAQEMLCDLEFLQKDEVDPKELDNDKPTQQDNPDNFKSPLETRTEEIGKRQESLNQPMELTLEIMEDVSIYLESPNNIKSTLKSKTEQIEKHQESSIEPMELTPSTDIPAAAPNSINSKTYCLMFPTDRSSTTLLPLGISNTVDDASSIISDSTDNNYDSDASYSSFYSISDARLIWRRALSQRKLQKRRQFAKRRVCRLNLRRWSIQKGVKKPKTPSKRRIKADLDGEEDADVSTLTEWQNKKYKQLENEIHPKLSEDQIYFKTTDRHLLVYKTFNCVRLLKKFDSSTEQRLKVYFERTHLSLKKVDQWMIHLYDAMQHFYYVDHSKPKALPKPILPVLYPHNYNNLMKLLNLQPCAYARHEKIQREQPKQKPQIKLTIHVNPPVNIMPIIAVDGYDNAEDIQSGTSSSDMNSENESVGADSEEPYSSSGFVESTESASSGIDTSQYGSNSSTETSDDGETSDDKETSYNETDDDDTESSEVSLTLTADTDESDTEEEDCDDDTDTDNTVQNAAGGDLVLAQARWQHLFEQQYQFIASYVDNYMASYGHQN
ncbi:probable ATP-dependent RNA helicase DDX20 [Drosophila innubila]|uniref:probable ATP-dependent RNA helicase DDX20 n=1 Tax=Drosophila innubila TaxID=198719 RepID=UPI00148C203A|nr:probable ATP-dependent RNA helicase DDX20 [Drosophila innubila]